MVSRRTKRRAATSAAATIAVAAFVVFLVVPARVEKGLNRTLVPPPYIVAPAARALHSTLTVVDLHADSLLWDRDLLEHGTRGHVDVPRLIEGNVALQAFTIVTKAPRHQNIDYNSDETDNITLLGFAEAWPPRAWTNLTERALFQAGKLQDVECRSNGTFTLIRSASDLAAYLDRRSRERAITAGFLGVEGAQALGGNLDNLNRLFDAGVRMMAPTHFTDNDIGGSASGANKGGLTEMGRQLVRQMEARGMIVDLAHGSSRTIEDTLAIATRPVVVSHTGVRGTCDNARNLSDAQLVGIAATGGVIGVGYWPHAVCGDDVRSIVRAIHHAVAVAGIDHVALGSDFDGTTTTPFDTSGVAQVTEALLADGFSDAEITKIMGQNTLRVLMQGLPR